MSRWKYVKGRSILGPVTGIAGLLAGAAATWLGSIALAGLAGGLVAVAVVAAALTGRRLEHATRDIADLGRRIAALEGDLDRELRGRREAEQRLTSRIQLTAMRDVEEKDKLVDPESGLYNEGYFTVALDARIASARRNLKPLTVVVLEAVHGLQRGNPTPIDPRIAANGILVTVREADTTCRLVDGSFGLILDDTDENGGIWTVERIRRTLCDVDSELTLWAGIACYPAHGLTTADILDRADIALDTAREWRQDRIEVATTDS